MASAAWRQYVSARHWPMAAARRQRARRYRFEEGPAALAVRVPEVPGAAGTRGAAAAPGPRHSALPRVLQVLDSQYGTYVWPCAVVLAQYLWAHRRSLPGKRVLEVPPAPRPVPPVVTRGSGSARGPHEHAVVSDRCRCEPPRRSGRQVRCPGDPVRQRGAAPVPAELPQQLPHEPPAPRARPRPHLGPRVP